MCVSFGFLQIITDVCGAGGAGVYVYSVKSSIIKMNIMLRIVVVFFLSGKDICMYII